MDMYGWLSKVAGKMRLVCFSSKDEFFNRAKNVFIIDDLINMDKDIMYYLRLEGI